MMGLKPKRKDKNKVRGDSGGYFETARAQLLSRPAEFIKRMQNYDKDNIPGDIIGSVTPITKSKEFSYAKVKNAS